MHSKIEIKVKDDIIVGGCSRTTMQPEEDIAIGLQEDGGVILEGGRLGTNGRRRRNSQRST